MGAMAEPVAALNVHLVPHLVDPVALRGGVAVVIDVLRATTTIAHALHAGISAIYPVGEIPAALALAEEFQKLGETVLMGGERDGVPVAGFDLGNSPQLYVWDRCQGRKLILTTTNGTRALLHAAAAARVLTAGFVNFSAVCETLLPETRPLHFLCAGTSGDVTLEDTLLAGAFIAALVPHKPLTLNDSARLAWDTFDCHGLVLEEALRISGGGKVLESAGCRLDLAHCARVDHLLLVPELRRDPQGRPFLEIGSIGLQRRLWPGK
jgi:2-phosphosulfolactate phosphatase